MQNEAGDIQILAFHLPGKIIGLDALASNQHVSHAEALERSASANCVTDRYQRLQRDGTALNPSMSHYDIANYLGLVVETVSRLFSRMEEMGVLEVNRKPVRILRPDMLSSLCRNDAASKRKGAG